jgi:hypothetical protein
LEEDIHGLQAFKVREKKKRRRSNSRLQIPSHPTTDQKEACIVPE